MTCRWAEFDNRLLGIGIGIPLVTPKRGRTEMKCRMQGNMFDQKEGCVFHCVFHNAGVFYL
jgi:hypothetical protein